VLARVRRSIEKRGYPRTALSLILGACGLFALFLSVVLLRVGVLHMGIRYVVCFGLAYALFLVLVRAWASRDLSELDIVDFPEMGGAVDGSSPSLGSGGEFGGGGASGSWEDPAAPAVSVSESSDALSASVADAVPSIDLDDGWVVVLPIALAVSGFVAAGYVIWIAPALLAEVALDVAIAAGAYRGAIRLQPSHWAVGVLGRTWVAALALAAFLGGVGFALQSVAPDTHTIGSALASLSG
jgi:hypothetical protein